MNDEDFSGIMAGIKDAIAYAKGDHTRGRVVLAVDVRAVRKQTGLTQDAFASAFKLPLGTVRDWEQKRRSPDAPARALLKIIERDPQTARKLLETA